MGQVVVEYWQERKSKTRGSLTFRYRRAVDKELRLTLGKGEITIALGKSKVEALAKYRQVHREVERMLATAWDEVRGIKRPKTARELFHETVEQMKALGLNPYRQSVDDQAEADDHDDTYDWIMRSAVVDGIAAKYPVDPETGYPLGVSAEDTRLVRLLQTSNPKVPAATVEDAAKLYLKDRFDRTDQGPGAQTKDEQRVARVVRAIAMALGRMPTVASITREEARKVQAHIRGTVRSKATVDRYLNDIRAIISHAIREMDELHGLTNYFTGLADLAGGRNGGVLPQEERRALSPVELQRIRARIEAKARLPEVALIWRLLEGTGCRLSEITGLRVEDVVTDGDLPYVDVAWLEERRLKNTMSRRRVPLIGDALAAAREAATRAGQSPMLFARFGREGGGTAASALLMKHVRAVTDDPKAVVHSLRRNIKERLMEAGVDKPHQNLILGHTLQGEGERYGGPAARLVDATREMRKAFQVGT